eukprot:Pompholyxophrys_punicea_v1_NODE_432_length_1983_cov_3.433091.p1 type:complete len:317 gc:universal NODE_432_length_1983_cov_3.433091:534-1484(+)
MTKPNRETHYYNPRERRWVPRVEFGLPPLAPDILRLRETRRFNIGDKSFHEQINEKAMSRPNRETHYFNRIVGRWVPIPPIPPAIPAPPPISSDLKIPKYSFDGDNFNRYLEGEISDREFRKFGNKIKLRGLSFKPKGSTVFTSTSSQFKNIIKKYTIDFHEGDYIYHIDTQNSTESKVDNIKLEAKMTPALRTLCGQILHDFKQFKVVLSIFARYTPVRAGNVIYKWHSSKSKTVLNQNQIGAAIREMFNDIMQGISEETGLNASGYKLDTLIRADLSFFKHRPLRGATFIELPKWIKDKKAVANINNSTLKDAQ